MMEPVAWRIKDFADGWFYLESKESAEGYKEMYGSKVEPLVRLSDAEARIATLEAALSSAKDDVDLWQHRSSVWKKRAEEEEARAEAAEALLKEAGPVIVKLRKALEPLVNSVFNDNGDITVTVTHITHEHCEAAYFADRAARAIHHKIGVKDE